MEFKESRIKNCFKMLLEKKNLSNLDTITFKSDKNVFTVLYNKELRPNSLS